MSWWQCLDAAKAQAGGERMPVADFVALVRSGGGASEDPFAEPDRDAFDELSALIGADALSYRGDGGAMLRLDPAACLIDGDTLRLHREVPVTLRMPVLGASSLRAEIAVSNLQPFLAPTVTSGNASLTVEAFANALEVTVENQRQTHIDLTLVGHRVTIEGLSVYLPNPQGAAQVADPLDVHSDPLARY